MISVRCMLCLNKEVKRLEKLAEQENWDSEKQTKKIEGMIKMTGFDIRSNVIGKSLPEEYTLLGLEITKHMQANHEQELQEMAMLAPQFNGFGLMKYFETEDPESNFEKEKELMRERLLESVMQFGGDDEDDDDDDLDEDTGDDLLEDEDDDDEDDELEDDDEEDENMFEDEDSDEEDESLLEA